MKFKLNLLFLACLAGIFIGCNGNNQDKHQKDTTNIIESGAEVDNALEQARLDSIRQESILQDSIAREKEKIARAMPTPQMFGEKLASEAGATLKSVSSLRKRLPSLGYEKINNNKFALKEGGDIKVSVKLNYQEFEGEYDPEQDDYVGGGMTYDIILTYASPADAKAFYASWQKACKSGWLSAILKGNTVTLNDHGD